MEMVSCSLQDGGARILLLQRVQPSGRQRRGNGTGAIALLGKAAVCPPAPTAAVSQGLLGEDSLEENGFNVLFPPAPRLP